MTPQDQKNIAAWLRSEIERMEKSPNTRKVFKPNLDRMRRIADRLEAEASANPASLYVHKARCLAG